MRITDLHMQTIEPRLATPIKLAYGTVSSVESVIIRIDTESGTSGHGEASTIAFVTGETPETIVATLARFRAAVIGQDALAVGRVHALMDAMIRGNSAAKAAVDIALYDILGKSVGRPLYRLLGAAETSFATDVMISIDAPDAMAEEARSRCAQGFTALKVKAGREVTADIEAARKIREAVGPEVVLRIDANQGWTIAETLKVARELQSHGIRGIEQPVPFWDVEGMARLRGRMGPIELIADESLHSPQDAVRLVRAAAADMFSIKLAKAGGIYRALQINAVAEASGVSCMLGCMPETRIATTAAAHLKAAQANIAVADLDAAVLVVEPRIEGGFAIDGETITLSDRPGLGVEVRI